LHLHREVAVHVLDRVLDARLFLDVCAAAGIEHAPADRGRTAAFEAIQYEDVGPALSGFEGGGDARGAQPYDDQICYVVPVRALGILDYEWRQVAHLDAGS